MRGVGEGRIFLYASLPQILPQLLSYTLYRWENNIRAAAVLGAAGNWVNASYAVPWWGRRELSGGPVNEQATHLVDLARHLVGEVRGRAWVELEIDSPSFAFTGKDFPSVDSIFSCGSKESNKCRMRSSMPLNTLSTITREAVTTVTTMMDNMEMMLMKLMRPCKKYLRAIKSAKFDMMTFG